MRLLGSCTLSVEPLRANDASSRATVDTTLGELRTEDMDEILEKCPGLKLKMMQFLKIGKKTGVPTADMVVPVACLECNHNRLAIGNL
jgi:hypothetical protein